MNRRRLCCVAALLIAAALAPAGEAAAQIAPPEPARTPLAPYRYPQPPAGVDAQSARGYRLDLESRRQSVERSLGPLDLRGREELRALDGELDRLRRLGVR